MLIYPRIFATTYGFSVVGKIVFFFFSENFKGKICPNNVCAHIPMDHRKVASRSA